MKGLRTVGPAGSKAWGDGSPKTEDPNIEPEQLWEPDGGSYYNGELIVQPQSRSTEEQLWLLDNHPMFTGSCPQCGYEWESGNYPMSQWECPECDARGDGWELPDG